jgi:hypothetical protein
VREWQTLWLLNAKVTFQRLYKLNWRLADFLSVSLPVGCKAILLVEAQWQMAT